MENLTEQELDIQRQISEISAQQFQKYHQITMESVLEKLKDILADNTPPPVDPEQYWIRVISTEVLSAIISTESTKFRLPSDDIIKKQCNTAVDYARALIQTIEDRS